MRRIDLVERELVESEALRNLVIYGFLPEQIPRPAYSLLRCPEFSEYPLPVCIK